MFPFQEVYLDTCSVFVMEGLIVEYICSMYFFAYRSCGVALNGCKDLCILNVCGFISVMVFDNELSLVG